MLFVLVPLAVSVVIVAIVGIVAFVDVAFHPPAYSVASPPVEALRGSSTFTWFSATAERFTRGLIEARRDAGEAFHAGGIAFGAAEPRCGECAHEPIDSGSCSTRIGTTPPEALEIAEFLRKTQPEERVEMIRREAESNARLHKGLHVLDGSNAVLHCPLACDDGTCMAMPVRPIQCRVHCELFGHRIADDAQLVTDGVEDGFRKAMTAVCPSKDLYELNSALATALSVPNAAERWSGGENPFSKCTAYALS